MSQSEQPDPIFFTYSWFMFLRCTYIYILSTYSCDPVIGLMTFVPHPLKRVVRIEGDVCSSSSSSTFSRSFLPLLSELLSPTYPTDPAPVSLGLPPPVAPPSFRQIQPQALWDSLWSSPDIPDRFSPRLPGTPSSCPPPYTRQILPQPPWTPSSRPPYSRQIQPQRPISRWG